MKIWNDTVANLTLMALGSSAPEIMLSCVELFGKGFKSGDLGPSTIVGSASFNLMVIIAICVASIPEGETRFIKEIDAYFCTAFFSVASYIWMTFILSVYTENVVDLWEAVVTLLYFPFLVVISYAADKGNFQPTRYVCCGCCKKSNDDEVEDHPKKALAGSGEQEAMYKAKKAIHRSHILMGCEYEGEEETVDKVLVYLKNVAKIEMDAGELDVLIRHERRKHIYYNHHHGGGKGADDGAKDMPVSNKANVRAANRPAGKKATALTEGGAEFTNNAPPQKTANSLGGDLGGGKQNVGQIRNSMQIRNSQMAPGQIRGSRNVA